MRYKFALVRETTFVEQIADNELGEHSRHKVTFSSVAKSADGFIAAANRVHATAKQKVQEISSVAGERVPLSDVRKATENATVWLTENATAFFNDTLSSAEFSRQIDGWIRDKFASGRATLYDNAMDAAYNDDRTGLGGGYHRLFDGGHTLEGAWAAMQDAADDSLIDDSLVERVQGYFTALMKDFVTPMGLPFVTQDKQNFDAVVEAFDDCLGVSCRAWLADTASLTATELLGSIMGVVSVALNWSAVDVQKFSGLVSRLGLSSIASGNPILFLVAVIALARAYQDAKNGDDLTGLAKGLVKGGVGTGISIAVASLAPPVWMGVIIIICVGVVSNKAVEKGEQVVRETDWTEVAGKVRLYLVRSAPGFRPHRLRGIAGPGEPDELVVSAPQPSI